MHEVFNVTDATWRGLGKIPESGLAIKKKYKTYDAKHRFSIEEKTVASLKGCDCGNILTGRKIPPECLLYRKACTPDEPIGPCMVSTEGTCAAYYKYHDR